MVLTVLKGLGKAYLKGKGKKLRGAKSVEHWKSRMDMKKVINKASDVAESLRGTAKNLRKLNETLKKQKNIIGK